MFNRIVENYINKLTQDDIKNLGLKNNIILNDNEINYIYKIIKNDYKLLLSDNYNIVFNKAKKYITENNYKKIYNLFIDYRNKYYYLIK